LWQFTNEFGKRAVSSWHMSVEEAKRYKDAVPVPWTREIRKSVGSMSDFNPWRSTSGKDDSFESPWQLIRFGYLRGVKRQGFEMSFVPGK
jgi:hypothetical protein